MTKITQMTEAQIARFPEFVDKWTKIGLCTAPANRPEAERGIVEAYLAAGLAPPKDVVWCGSPVSMLMHQHTIELGGRRIGDRILENAYQTSAAIVTDRVGDPAWAIVRAMVADGVAAIVGGSGVIGYVSDGATTSVFASVEGSVDAAVGRGAEQVIKGQHDISWLAFYDYFRLVVGLTKLIVPLGGLMTIAKNAGWWLPCAEVCFISERYNVCNVDAQYRVHCETGPAIAYPDGFEIYAVDGKVYRHTG